MVDEWEAAAEAPAPVRAAGEADDVAEAPEAEVEIISGADKSLRGRAASQSPSAGSDVPRLADGPRAAPSAGLGVGGAPGDDPKAGSHRSDVCPPLWKVSLRAARLPPTPSLDIWMISCLLLMWPRSESAAVPGWVLLRVQLAHDAWFARTLLQVLQPHQVEGVGWLFKAVHGGGGLLADDPGLGKTLQVITVLEALIRAEHFRRVLIVTPANLLANWDAVRNLMPIPIGRLPRLHRLGTPAFRSPAVHVRGSDVAALARRVDPRTCC
eukprot:CAMPEP_0174742180 /NCGR_PEP_ID=MMETSP1094-20130205/78207_1 /TAXON_ID=156173 /ORGANISM="Chrysochromulina brevifilum, Strain UTEX LB 985" /LENGTH=267 /DNA_ID=CAMNT_0015946195 /DNA_START=73 /DNA_END=874 /DNA_ORIENTATION=+